MLEHISIWTGVKRWTEASGGDNGRTGEAGFICTKMIEEVFDVYSVTDPDSIFGEVAVK